MVRAAYEKEFEVQVDRVGTWSAKWDFPVSRLGEEVICMSVADMEYLSCPLVRQAVVKAAQHGIYGYTDVFPDFAQTVQKWHRRHGLELPLEEIVFFPRIVQMVSALVNFCLEVPLKVAVIEPAYDPIIEVLRKSKCDVRIIKLTEKNWTFNPQELEKIISEVDLFMFCSPHNPTGRVWTAAELVLIGELALKYRTLVISDDVHCEFVRAGKQYIPLAVAYPPLLHAGLLISAFSPGKTFNMAGLEVAAIHIPELSLRGKLLEAKRRMGIHNPNYFAIPAVITAWTEGETWLNAAKQQIDSNIAYSLARIAEHMPLAYAATPEGTYLLWLNVGSYFQTHEEVVHWTDNAKVLLSLGDAFGSGYQHWVRLNVAMPRPQLDEALNRLFTALPKT